MPIGDYATSTEYKKIDTGCYIVSIDEVRADMTGKPFLNVRYRIKGGPFDNQCVFKKYYFTENTFKKFMPWQLGIMGVWHDVKECETFEAGMMKAVELLSNLDTLFNADIELENWEYEGKTGVRNNIVLDSEYVGAVPSGGKDEPKFNPDEKMPF